MSLPKNWISPARNLFSSVRGNARVIVITEGISNIAFQWYGTYLSLYFLALGLDEVTIGWLASASLLTQVASTLLGGNFADRFGRKRVLVVGDILCWGIPLILYGIAQNPWYLVAGRLLNGFIYVVFPSFECLFVEDVAENQRPAVFGVLQFLMAAGSLLAPLAGLFVARNGMVAGGRIIMLSTAGMSVMIAIVRQLTLRETSMGRERMAVTAASSMGGMIKDYTGAIRAIASDRRVWSFLGVRILGSASGVVWGTYAMIFLTAEKGAGLPESSISFVPALSAVVTLATVLFSARWISGRYLFINMVVGQLFWLFGALVFLMSPVRPLLMAALWTILNAVSIVLFQPAGMSYWANITDERQRALIFSTATALISLFTIPIGPLAGYMYQVSPRMPFLFAIALQGIVTIAILATVERNNN